MTNSDSTPIQPISGTVIPRFAGPSTFARLPELRDVSHCDVAIGGIPFDAPIAGGALRYIVTAKLI